MRRNATRALILIAAALTIWLHPARAGEAKPVVPTNAVSPAVGETAFVTEGEIVLRGNIAGPRHRHSYINPAQVSQDPDGNDLVIYATDGSPEIQAEFCKVITNYFPDRGLDAKAAIELQKQIDAHCKYYIDAPDAVRKLIPDSPYGIGSCELKGTVSVKDGKQWISVPDANHVNRNPKWNKSPAEVGAKLGLHNKPDEPFLPTGDPLTLKISDTLEIKCILVPAGKFLMGKPYWMSGQYAEEPPHVVTLTKSYYMSETVVDQEIYEAIMGEPAAPPKPSIPIEKNLQLPVLGVDNPHRDEFFKRLSEKTGRKCRLPTAAEWEYAARCGTSNPPWGWRYKDQDSQDTSRKGYWHMSLPVKSKKPNAWGFYDMMCSLWEIVGDTALDHTLDIVETVDPFHPIPAGIPPAKAAHNAYGKEFDITETSAGEAPGDERGGSYMERFRIVVEVK
jgi:formylglycine-generating enzyme required for sulfatase activity